MSDPALKDAEAVNLRSSNTAMRDDQSSLTISSANDAKLHPLVAGSTFDSHAVRPRSWLRRFNLDYILGIALAAGMAGAYYFHLGPFAPPPVDFHPYMVALQHEIKGHWTPSNKTSSKVKIHFKVHKNGELSDVGFDRMSRISEDDAGALKSIVESMPALPALPPGSPDVVDIDFSFENNVKRKSPDSVNQSQKQ